MVGVSVWDVLAFWGWSLLLLVALYVGFATMVYLVAVVGPVRGAFREDVRHKHDRKRGLRSGRRLSSRYLYLLGVLLLDSGVQATLLYRMSAWSARHGLRLVAEMLHAWSKFLTHIDVSPLATIGGGLAFFHGSGAVIGKGTRMGARVTVCQGVTTGAGRPVIGDDVILWAGAKVLGDVTVGHGAQVGANAVVRADVAPGHVAVGVPARGRPPRSGVRHELQD